MDGFCKTTVPPLNQTFPRPPLITVNASLLIDVCREFSTQAKYSEPMVPIGYYITGASTLCFVLMMHDLLIGIATKKFWIPAIFFPLNSISITIMAIAIKLPSDLSSPMPSLVDQATKIRSLGFQCTMMSHLMPSVGSITNNKSNVAALSLLVITLIVDVGIQLKTGVISNEYPIMLITCVYMGMLLFLLTILISSSIAVSSVTKTLESKYQALLSDQIPQENLIHTLRELRQLVKRYWIMAQTASPQFVMASSPLSSASAMIPIISMAMQLFLFTKCLTHDNKVVIPASGYATSVDYIYVMQTFGDAVAFIVSIFRCLSILKFKLSTNQNTNISSVFEVEKYWTEKTCDKDNDDVWLSICIGLHEVTMVLSKTIELVPLIFAKYISYYFKSPQAILFSPPTTSSNDDTYQDLSKYVLSLEHNVSITKYSLERSLASLDSLIHNKGLIREPNNVLKLLEKSVSFDRVKTFDTNQVPSLLPVELVNSWSLPIISLTCIAITIPGIDNYVVANLYESVREGILYTHMVEQSLNREPAYVNIRMVTKSLWHDVVVKCKWMGSSLKRSAYEGETPAQIIKLFAQRAEEIVDEFKRSTNNELVEENLPPKLIAANSMYRIAQTIMHTYESNNLKITERELFTRLSLMIADILAACLTNIPKVIIMKCHESAIEKREGSVMDAVILLESTSKIIRRLETHELPNMDQDKMAFIDEWYLHLRQP